MGVICHVSCVTCHLSHVRGLSVINGATPSSFHRSDFIGFQSNAHNIGGQGKEMQGFIGLPGG